MVPFTVKMPPVLINNGAWFVAGFPKPPTSKLSVPPVEVPSERFDIRGAELSAGGLDDDAKARIVRDGVAARRQMKPVVVISVPALMVVLPA